MKHKFSDRIFFLEVKKASNSDDIRKRNQLRVVFCNLILLLVNPEI